MKRMTLWIGIGMAIMGLVLIGCLVWIGYLLPLRRQALVRETLSSFSTTPMPEVPTSTPSASVTPLPLMPSPIPKPTPKPVRQDFLLEIPAIGLEWVVHEPTVESDEPFNIAKSELDQWGVVIFPHYAYPGEIGVAALAGHRDMSGAPFWRLEELKEGDEINISLQGDCPLLVYQVFDLRYVEPDDLSVLKPINEGIQELRLITCLVGSQRQRVVVFAKIPIERRQQWDTVYP